MPTDTTVNNLIINKLTKAQYEGIVSPSDTELYLVPDEIDATPTSGSDNPVKSGGVYTALTGVHQVPSGGNSGQVLKKSSGTDYDYAWANQTQDYPSAYCTTSAGTAAKKASCSLYAAQANSYLHVLMGAANTSAGAITLNVNSAGAKPVYINGTASSASNYTIPAGSYIVFYDGTNYYLRTDGKIPGPNNTTLALSSDISAKEDKIPIVAGSGTALTAAVNTAYNFASEVGTLAVTLPVPSDTSHVNTIVFWFTTSASPNVTFTSSSTVRYHDGYELEASTMYEVNAAYNGSNWVISSIKIATS